MDPNAEPQALPKKSGPSLTKLHRVWRGIFMVTPERPLFLELDFSNPAELLGDSGEVKGRGAMRAIRLVKYRTDGDRAKGTEGTFELNAWPSLGMAVIELPSVTDPIRAVLVGGEDRIVSYGSKLLLAPAGEEAAVLDILSPWETADLENVREQNPIMREMSEATAELVRRWYAGMDQRVSKISDSGSLELFALRLLDLTCSSNAELLLPKDRGRWKGEIRSLRRRLETDYFEDQLATILDRASGPGALTWLPRWRDSMVFDGASFEYSTVDPEIVGQGIWDSAQERVEARMTELLDIAWAEQIELIDSYRDGKGVEACNAALVETANRLRAYSDHTSFEVGFQSYKWRRREMLDQLHDELKAELALEKNRVKRRRLLYSWFAFQGDRETQAYRRLLSVVASLEDAEAQAKAQDLIDRGVCLTCTGRTVALEFYMDSCPCLYQGPAHLWCAYCGGTGERELTRAVTCWTCEGTGKSGQ